jgi:hypothetical protein
MLIHASQIRKYIRDKTGEKHPRVSKEFLAALDGKVRNSIDFALALPCNKKTVRDLATGVKR